MEGNAADRVSFPLNLNAYLFHAVSGQEDIFVACLYQRAELPETVNKRGGGEKEGRRGKGNVSRVTESGEKERCEDEM